MPQQGMVACRHAAAHPVGKARRVLTGGVAGPAEGPGLIESRPVLHPVAKGARGDVGIVSQALCRISVVPTAPVLEVLRQVPVVEGDKGRDPRRQQAVDQPVVEGNALGRCRAGTAGLDARPGQREAIGIELELAHQGYVFRPAVIMIAGHVARALVDYHPRLPAEPVPDALALAAGCRRALDLVGCRCCAEDEVLRQAQARSLVVEDLPLSIDG